MIIIDVVDDGDMNMMMMTKNKDDLEGSLFAGEIILFF